MQQTVPVPLYHATYAQVPDALASGLHNVAPAQLRLQLRWLREHFDVVPLDDLLDDYAPGKAAVTFDDGYMCVFDETLPLLRELDIPATVFVNGFALEGRIFWRDKVRAVLSAGLHAGFADFAARRAGLALPASAKGVYRATKAPDGPSSRVVEALLDEFLKGREELLPETDCCAPAHCLPRDPLLTYGNHSRNHYVLSTLSPDEQREEIAGMQRTLQSMDLPLSSVFSIPFGGDADFDAHTLAILKEEGLHAALSRNRIGGPEPVVLGGVRAVERFMAPPDLHSFEQMVTGHAD